MRRRRAAVLAAERADAPLQMEWPGTLDALAPLEVVAVVAGILGAGLLGGYLLYRRRERTKADVLWRRLQEVEEVTVLMHPRPDPDAMACAVALGRIAERAGTRATVQYPGQIRHPENRAFRVLLDLDLEQISHVRDLASDAVVLVDHNRARGFEGSASVSPYAVVDHHPGGGTGQAFTDVRPEYGACSTILAEYYRDLADERTQPAPEGNGEGDDQRLPTDVATGLAYGILTDTKNLTKGCSSAEFDAMEYLYPCVDQDLLDRIANPGIDEEVLEVLSRAIADRDQRAPYVVTDVGDVENLDAIPQAADELLNLEGVTAVVVVGEKDGTLHFSGRSRDDRVHVGSALESAVDDIPMAGAGGHARMGGGQVSLDHMEGLRPDSGLSRDQFHERLFDAMAGEQ